ncbi:unnamed protein product [Calypogeia fissa]
MALAAMAVFSPACAFSSTAGGVALSGHPLSFTSSFGSVWIQDSVPVRRCVSASPCTLANLQPKTHVKKTGVAPSATQTATEATQQFLFHTEGGGQVRATVDAATAATYNVEIRVDLPETPGSFVLHWGLFRSNSRDWVLLDPDSAPPDTKYIMGKTEAMRTPLQAFSSRQQMLKLEFNAEKAPFYVHFVLYKPAVANMSPTWIRNSIGGNFCIPVGVGKGRPEPLGLTQNRDGTANFALYSKNAETVVLCLYGDEAVEPSMEIDLDPLIHRTGDVWHVKLKDISGFTRYGYRCKGELSWESGNRFQTRNVLLDPYAKLLAPFVPGQENSPSIAPVLGWLKTESVPFNWEDDVFLHTPLERLFAYRLNVAGFTADESSSLEEGIRGTFDGLVQKAQYLVNLGINAVILEPIFSHFDDHLKPFSFFTPAAEYGPGDSQSACTSLKRMVKQLHKLGIEVILEVVYSHTAEGGDESPKSVSFRGIDNSTFYILNEFGRVVQSEAGEDNAFNCNHPFVQSMIVDSLRYWVEEFHIDGFLFINGSALVTGPHGQELSRPPLVEAISFDPILASTKLIVNTSSPFTGVTKSLTFPHWRRWCEWNNSFRDDARRFMRGDLNQLSTFSTRLCGSGDLFASGRGPNHSFNFVTSSYGLTLADLVSYSESDQACGELSWNCGAEGPSSDDAVLETRVKQVRNFILALLLSEGVPVMNMGDEYGHSKGGNIGVDQSSRQFLWSYADTEFGQQMSRFISSLIDFRSRHKDLFERNKFGELGSITWHGIDSLEPQWDEQESPFLGAHLHADGPEGKGIQTADVYLAFNARQVAVIATLPEAPAGMTWYRVADTSLPHPDEFLKEGAPINVTGTTSTYEFQPNSAVVLEARHRFIVSRSKSSLKFPASKTPKQPLS